MSTKDYETVGPCVSAVIVRDRHGDYATTLLPSALAEKFDQLVGSGACLLVGLLDLAVGRPKHRLVLGDPLVSLIHAAESTPADPGAPASQTSWNTTDGKWVRSRRGSGDWGPLALERDGARGAGSVRAGNGRARSGERRPADLPAIRPLWPWLGPRVGGGGRRTPRRPHRRR